MLLSSYAHAQTAIPGPGASVDASGTYTVDASVTYKPSGGAFVDSGSDTHIVVNVVNGDTLNVTTGSLTLLDAYGNTNFPLQGGSIEFNGNINAVGTSNWPTVTYFNSNHGGHLTINGDLTLSATNTGRLTTLVAAEADNAKTILNGSVHLNASTTYNQANVMSLSALQATSHNQNGALTGDNTYLSVGRQGEGDTLTIESLNTTNTYSGAGAGAQTTGLDANGFSVNNAANVPVTMDIFATANLSDFTASGYDSAIVRGALANGEGKINFYKPLSMQNFRAITSDATGLSEAYGVKATDTGVINFYAPVVIQDIVAQNTGGGNEAYATGAETGDGGVLNFYSDLSIKNIAATGTANNFPYAFYAADGGIINVNPNSNPDSVIQIEGAVQAGGATSEINLNLTNKDSYFRGIEDIVPAPYDNGQFNLSLSNEASWQLDGGSYVTGNGPYEVLGFTSNGGVFDTGSWSFGNDIASSSLTFKDVTIQSVNGSSTTFALRTDLNNNTGDFIHITDLNTPTNYLQIYDVAMWQEQTSAGNEVHVLTADNGVGSLTAQEVDSVNSLYKYRPELDIRNNNQDVYVTGFTQGQNSTVAMVFLDAGTAAFTSWRADSKLLRQRMSDLRSSQDKMYGGWARAYNGEFKYNGSSSTFKNKSAGSDVGFDLYRDYDQFHQISGFSVGYRDNDFKYPIGKGDGNTYSLALYNTLYTDRGFYLDTVLKGSYLDNEIKYASNGDYVKGDYNTYGIQLQLEAGKRQDMTDLLFVEPFVMANLGHLSGQDYTTNNGIKIKHDGSDSFVGGVGLYLGSDFKIHNKSNVFYVKGVGKKEFLGTTKTKMFSASGEYLYNKEKFDDAWFEYGMGYTLFLQNNIQLFADVERSANADYKMPWQVNLGVRVDF